MISNLDLKAGILGGGQLAWMLNLSAQKFGIHTRVWDPARGASGFRAAGEIHSSPWDSPTGVEVFCKGLDFCTLEWESIPLSLLEAVEASGTPLMPSSHAVRSASSRILERELFTRLGFATAPMLYVKSPGSLSEDVWQSFTGDAPFTKVFLKHDRGGYDGKGQSRIEASSSVRIVRDFFSLGDSRGIIEAQADLAFEVSVVAARSASGNFAVLGLFENQHENGVLRVTRLARAGSFDHLRAVQMMESLLSDTDYVGVAALELFVEKSGKILANEWAPRVHNSGHVSLEVFEESQFDFHWRAVANLKFPENPAKHRAVMINVLGDDLTGEPSFTRRDILEGADPKPFLAKHLRPEELRAVRKVLPYDYGKKDIRPGRKMGHLNVILQQL
ncbi:MAG TPA: ATP-grasp domain-containing protein [Bdellovibrionota bacterium]|jgi:5-(carboxyamino)imidazole ribonucleotide synthase|nr:ATP-grasp domain-containing protein [Bdellovibrionota bacterium]